MTNMGFRLMKVFLDTNIFMEFVAHRQQEALVFSIFKAISDKKLTAFVSVGGMYNIAYLLGQIFKRNGIHQPKLNEEVRRGLNGQLELANAVDCSQDTIKEAINDERFTDIEDSFQYHCAVQYDCNVLITINIKDYKNVLDGKTKVMTPQEFIDTYLQQD